MTDFNIEHVSSAISSSSLPPSSSSSISEPQPSPTATNAFQTDAPNKEPKPGDETKSQQIEIEKPPEEGGGEVSQPPNGELSPSIPSPDGQDSNGSCTKQTCEKTETAQSNGKENGNQKKLLFVDQPETEKHGNVVRKKPSFRDVSLYDVIMMASSPNSSPKIKGILKSSNSSPALGQGKEQTSFSAGPINGVGFEPGKLTKTASDAGGSRCVSFNKTHTKSTFSYHNAAFEGEIITEPSKRPSLADVVSHIMKQNAIVDMEDDNSHPYGRDSSLTDLMTGKRRDRYHIHAGKLIVWLTLAVMIVSLAAGIIFMSETYNLKHPDGPPIYDPLL
ncbi:hypothetical protein EGW08_015298, partial [Elysia chlorotica]